MIQTIMVEDNSLTHARIELASKTPRGFCVYSENVISEGRGGSWWGDGATEEEAFQKALSTLPEDATFIKAGEVVPPKREIIEVTAYDETSARLAAEEKFGSRRLGNKSHYGCEVKLKVRGHAGLFLGLGKRPNVYEVDILAALYRVFIDVRYKAKIVAEIGPVAEVVNRIIHEGNSSLTGPIGPDGEEYAGPRATAAKKLAKIRDPHAVDALIEWLGDHHEQVREAAAKALGEMGDERAIPPLQNALMDSYSYYAGSDKKIYLVREAAAHALSVIQRRPSPDGFGHLSEEEEDPEN